MSVVQAFGFPFAAGQTNASRGLTESQRETVSSVLSGFDADNLSTSDATSIRDVFREAGITPSRDLAQAIKAEGFDPEVLRSNDVPPPPPADEPSGKLNINLEALQQFAEIIEGYDPGSTSDEQLSQLVDRLREAGLTRTGSVFDIKV